ncbi:MAG TPA: hypothetical protein VFI29_10590 [Hanamia sp.]|nr:hypothetical protein [Hanamia sp.]
MSWQSYRFAVALYPIGTLAFGGLKPRRDSRVANLPKVGNPKLHLIAYRTTPIEDEKIHVNFYGLSE